MKTSFLLALLLSCWSQVQAADDDGKELPPIERYDYGMRWTSSGCFPSRRCRPPVAWCRW